MNADREAMGLSAIPVTDTFDSNALLSAEALADSYTHDVVVRDGGVNCENIGYIMGFNSSASDIYAAWKESPGHWAAMIDPYLQYCSVAKYGSYWVYLGYAANPIADGTMSTQEAVDAGLLEQVGTYDNGEGIYASPGVTVEDDEDILAELDALRGITD